MEHLLENKFMIKLQDFGQKLGKNKFLTARVFDSLINIGISKSLENKAFFIKK
ncbi:hypothetical protein PQ743_12135 [Thermoanaerobacterium thermosaccharolyticum]|uniref:hypothetical protein n=1 Tax=Thermoanaerobacterium thermosaccharolyticum TaxID=1517 RepID=UPI003DA8EA6E